jgi:cytochrome b involved in lipid metabolism
MVDAVVQGLTRLDIKVPDGAKAATHNKKETRTSYQITDQGAVVEQQISIPIPAAPAAASAEETKEVIAKPEPPAQATPAPIPPKLTLEEVAKHSSPTDCWIVLEDCVYNITDYIKQHPGKDKILLGAGKDATELFKKYHAYI